MSRRLQEDKARVWAFCSLQNIFGETRSNSRAKTNFGPIARIICTRVQRMTNPAGKWSIQPMYHGSLSKASGGQFFVPGSPWYKPTYDVMGPTVATIAQVVKKWCGQTNNDNL